MSAGDLDGRRTRTIDAAFRVVSAALCWALVALGFAALGLILVGLVGLAGSELALASALLSSLALVGCALAIAAPLGIATAIWIEGQPPDSATRRLAELDLSILDSVPGLVYGLATFVIVARGLGLGVGLASGAIALAATALPEVIAGARLALAEVSPAQLEAGYALGGSRGRLLVHVVLPAAARRLLAAVCRATAGAFGRAAPLLVLVWLGASSLDSIPALALPVQLYAGLDGRAAVAGAAASLVAVAIGLELLARGFEPRPRPRFGPGAQPPRAGEGQR